MLPRALRLTSEKRIDRVKSQSSQATISPIVLRWLSQEGGDQFSPSRVGFIVSRRVDQRAVVRHRIKRRLVEACRPLTKNLKPGYDILVVATSQAKEVSYQVLAKTLNLVFNQAGLLE